MNTRCDIVGFIVRRTFKDTVLRFLNYRLRRRRRTIVFFANPNLITQCWHLRPVISTSPDIFLLNDGLAIDVASFLRFGAAFPDNLNGTDFTSLFLSQLKQDSHVYLLGGRASVVEAAAKVFGRMPHVHIAGYKDGYSIWNDEIAVVEQIRSLKPDILLVALGNPRQEDWVLRQCGVLEVPIIMAVGALFDFVSGYSPRAPKFLRIVRLEWAHRLAHEPRRLTGRYTIGMVKFFLAVLKHSGKRSDSTALGSSDN
jgi:beta-1,4-glucosyltransferase